MSYIEDLEKQNEELIDKLSLAEDRNRRLELSLFKEVSISHNSNQFSDTYWCELTGPEIENFNVLSKEFYCITSIIKPSITGKYKINFIFTNKKIER